MNPSAVGVEPVDDRDLESVAPVGLDGGAGILPVDDLHSSGETIGCHGSVGNLQSVLQVKISAVH